MCGSNRSASYSTNYLLLISPGNSKLKHLPAKSTFHLSYMGNTEIAYNSQSARVVSTKLSEQVYFNEVLLKLVHTEVSIKWKMF